MDVTEFSCLYTIRLYFSTFPLFSVLSGIQDYMAANVYKICSELIIARLIKKWSCPNIRLTKYPKYCSFGFVLGGRLS